MPPTIIPLLEKSVLFNSAPASWREGIRFDGGSERRWLFQLTWAMVPSWRLNTMTTITADITATLARVSFVSKDFVLA